ncbi:MAG: glycosyltransferase family 4 protein [Rhodoferax sp.]|nr:glycosyltransferase family 4 protein [Rhodoferax sp.]
MLNHFERALRYQRIFGTRQLLREVWTRALRRLRGVSPALAQAGASVTDSLTWVSARELAARQAPACAALRLFTIPSASPGRISMVTDSINRGSLYGGVGTAIILAALLAQARGERLRIITRTERASPAGLATVLGTYGIALDHDIELAHAPFHDTVHEIDRFPGELFLTTSWWTTAATLGAVEPSAVVYLLQEDERMFYAHGDEHLRCARVLARDDIRFVINTRLLYDHLLASGLGQLAQCGRWFEPAFPSSVFHPAEPAPGSRRRLFFYARPNNQRNLFHFGLEVLEAAIARGIIDLQTWDLVLVGKDIPRLRFDEGRYTPELLENLSWTDYAGLVGRTDLGLCLMYTPHPSYPPLDLAASGAVVVTNTFGNKQDLSGYSPNILCAPPSLEPMLAALTQGLALAQDRAQRQANHRASGLGRDWRLALSGVVAELARRA